MHPWHQGSLHRHYLRELWLRLGLQYRDAPIAFMGAGKHTRAWITGCKGLAGPNITALLDDDAGAETFDQIPILRPADADPSAYAAVVVSSDAHAAALARRAREWSAHAARRPDIVEPYAALPDTPRELSLGAAPDAPPNTTLAHRHFLPKDPASPTLVLEGPVARATGDHDPLPPMRLRSGSLSDEHFLPSGAETWKGIRRILADHAVRPESFRSMLDWGCGSARVTRHWAELAPRTKLWGCDIDAEAIDWCQRALSPPISFFTVTTQPHLPLPDASIDFVFAYSVLSHVGDLWDAWLMELRRVVSPGGWLLMTALTEATAEYLHTHPEEAGARQSPGIDLAKPLRHDMVATARDHTTNVFWRTDAIRRRWSAYFDVVEIRHAALTPTQSGVLLRRTAD